MACGIDLSIASLDGLKDALDSDIQGLTSAVGGLATNIDAIKALATDQMAGIVTELTAALPDLAGLIPSSTLISDMTGLLATLSNPTALAPAALGAAFATETAGIVAKFGSIPGVDIAELANSVLSGGIDLTSVCSLIPNVEIDSLGAVLKKGTIPIPPTDAVAALGTIFNGLSQPAPINAFSLVVGSKNVIDDAAAATASAFKNYIDSVGTEEAEV